MTEWYVAHIIMYTKLKTDKQTEFPVMENLFLIKAESDDEAYDKAEKIGKECETDFDGTYTYDEIPASILFGGVRKLISCFKSECRPDDGEELTYSRYMVNNEEELKQLINGDSVKIEYIE